MPIAAEGNAACIRRNNVHYHAERRRFSGTVGTQEPVYAPLFNAEGDIRYGYEVTEPFMNVFELKEVHLLIPKFASLIGNRLIGEDTELGVEWGIAYQLRHENTD